jgi:hypothetical protein
LIVEHASTLVRSGARTGTLSAGSEDATTQVVDRGACLCLELIGWAMVRQTASAHAPVAARGKERRCNAVRLPRGAAEVVEALSCSARRVERQLVFQAAVRLIPPVILYGTVLGGSPPWCLEHNPAHEIRDPSPRVGERLTSGTTTFLRQLVCMHAPRLLQSRLRGSRCSGTRLVAAL